jgi:hypothetical protein
MERTVMPEQENASTTETDVQGNATETTSTEASAGSEQEHDAAYWKAEAEKWKALSRKNEKKATEKPAPKTSETSSTSDPMAQFRAEMAREKAQDKFEVAAEKFGVDLSDVMDYVALDAFLDGTKVKTDAINEFVGRFATKKSKFAQNVGVGPQGGGSTQLTKADLKNMSPEAIVKAQNEGRLDNLLGRSK